MDELEEGELRIVRQLVVNAFGPIFEVFPILHDPVGPATSFSSHHSLILTRYQGIATYSS